MDNNESEEQNIKSLSEIEQDSVLLEAINRRRWTKLENLFQEFEKIKNPTEEDKITLAIEIRQNIFDVCKDLKDARPMRLPSRVEEYINSFLVLDIENKTLSETIYDNNSGDTTTSIIDPKTNPDPWIEYIRGTENQTGFTDVINSRFRVQRGE